MRTSIAEEMNPQRRNTMEDVHVMYQPGTWNCHDPELAYMGVYDGHGGRDTVDFLQDALHVSIAEELRHGNIGGRGEDDKDRGGGEKDSSSHTCLDASSSNNEVVDNAPIETRLERAFLITDVESKMMGIQTSGATVCICLVKRDFDRKKVVVHAANAGDARAVISFSNAPVSCGSRSSSRSTKKVPSCHRMTRDHKADDRVEQERITNAGGFIMRQRVLGIMAVARSLGDAGLKDYIIGRPYCSSMEFHLDSIGEEKEFIILACDGLFDVMEDQESVDLVKEFVSYTDTSLAKSNSTDADTDEGEDIDYQHAAQLSETEWRKNHAAKMLCREALRRGSCDNITVVVLWL